MNDYLRVFLAAAGTVLLFLLVQLGALSLVEPFTQAGYEPVEDPTDPTNSAIFLAGILIATAFMLAAIKYGKTWVIKAAIVGVSVVLSWYVLVAVLPETVVLATPVGPLDPLPLAGALAVGVALVVHPEWYVIDFAGVLMGAGAAGLLGISFGVLPAIIFLVALAVYDAISVYRTKHMLTLAEGVMKLNVPVLFVVPTSLSYSFRDGSPDDAGHDGGATATDGEGEAGAENHEGPPEDHAPASEPGVASDGVDPDSERERDGPLVRDALFIGLGDAVMPTILVTSAATFVAPELATRYTVGTVTMNLPAAGAMLGTMVGLVILLRMVLRGRAHAGLPLLNGGAILGYLVGALASGLTFGQALGL